MVVKCFEVEFSEFSQESLVRSNCKTVFLGIEIKNYIQSSTKDFIRLKECFDIISGFAFKSADYEQEGLPLIRISDVENNFEKNSMVFLPEDYKISYSKFLLRKNDIIVSLTGDGKLKSDLISENSKYLLNQRVGALRAKLNVNILFFYYIINHFFLTKKQFYWWSNGKTQLNISPFDFLKIKIPVISKSAQDQIVAKIEPIEQRIKDLKIQTKKPQEVINKVFAREFGFDLENADERKKALVHYSSLQDFANEELKFDISLKYRYIFLNYIKNISEVKWVELGKLVNVKGGKRLPKGQNIMEEETDFKYIRVDDLSWSGVFDLNNIKYISQENHKRIKNYIAKENDILLTIVGATVGKCGIVPFELDGENITENFARLIIRDKANYLPEYLNYCLQSKTSLYQVDEYKGRGSQGKLALFRIKKIKIPKIDKLYQQKIVDEIKLELDKQEQIKKQIEAERQKIDVIIEQSISS